MKTIVLSNLKGGTAKTATAHNVAAGIAKTGRTVLLIDLDQQCNLSTDAGANLQTDKNILNLLLGQCSIDEAIQETAQGLYIVPATTELAGADIRINGNNKEYKLRNELQNVSFDYVIIDTPPALGQLTVQALTAADYVIIPANAEKHSIEGIGLLYNIIQSIKLRTNKDLKILCMLLTRYDKRSNLARDMADNIEQVAASLGTVLFDTPIRQTIKIPEAQALSKNIFDHAPSCNAAKDYKSFVNYIIKHCEK